MPSIQSPYTHGFFRVAACTPRVELADPRANLAATQELAQQADLRQVGLAVFPELGLSAYAIDDLLLQDALLDEVQEVLAELCCTTRDLSPILVVGAPLKAEGALFNCALAIHRGRILCAVPKTYLPNYREFYEKRHFVSARDALCTNLNIAGQEAPFGTDVLLEVTQVPGLAIHLEICEDLWVPLPPSSYAALAGATVLVNLSASNATIGKAEYRRLLGAMQSGRCIAAYVYSAAGYGESTTDLAWDGHAMIHENGELLAESQRFTTAGGMILADIDLDRLRQDRQRTTSFTDCASLHRDRLDHFRRVAVAFQPPEGDLPLQRKVERFPFVPSDPLSLDQRCAEVYAIQQQGLARRLQACGLEHAVIGISGGVDSAQAALITAGAFDLLGLPRCQIFGYSLPGLATGKHTRSNAMALMKQLGFSASEIDIRPACLQMLRDIGHPYARGEPLYDITFENVQAGERTSHLFRLANFHRGLVVGTGDLSELALGYTTYGVGDQMSHYGVNASLPKTLIRHLLHWQLERQPAPVRQVLRKILATASSPELVPTGDETQLQRAEDTVGPYALQDFFLYYISRFGYRPAKVAYLAEQAWGDAARGNWPSNLPDSERVAYSEEVIRHWLAVFLQRFFAGSQFKRSALPNGPKVGSGGSLSPRSDWRAPSDSHATVWLDALNRPRRR
ncbi:NAD(+) synthase [Metapseudomonas boanensis]|uniref:Glutamine-dependent NAD(+) synthetase n=1 Tax=Metapseudomonas boanensis TaxID=2822138 RepID=A0ABS5XLF5_9GAMM|nr:NAD(+) synthase [Pseudomonas boanensis]MBT8768539.1 NAD(+) synthase [Pseudomonas boanensis]